VSSRRQIPTSFAQAFARASEIGIKATQKTGTRVGWLGEFLLLLFLLFALFCFFETGSHCVALASFKLVNLGLHVYTSTPSP
jgi:hypothetical protein